MSLNQLQATDNAAEPQLLSGVQFKSSEGQGGESPFGLALGQKAALSLPWRIFFRAISLGYYAILG